MTISVRDYPYTDGLRPHRPGSDDAAPNPPLSSPSAMLPDHGVIPVEATKTGDVVPAPWPTVSHAFGDEETAVHDILLRGMRVTYFDGGDRTAPAAVCLHGLGRARGQWDRLARELLSTHRVIALDFPGFGDSARPSPARYGYSFEALAETALDLVAALGLGRVAMIGHSIGAGAAIVAATDRPESVARLVLVSPPCYPSARTLGERLASMPLIGGPLFRGVLGGAALRRRHGADEMGEASFRMLRHAAHSATLAARIPRLRAATMVVWGRDDAVKPWTHATRLAREIAGARLEILDCGHDPAAERPAAFAVLVARFLADEAAASRRPLR